MKRSFGSIYSERLRLLADVHPLQAAIGFAMIAGIVVAMLFASGYAAGKDMALADNRADQTATGREL